MSDANAPTTATARELLRDHAHDPVKQATGIRALVPGKTHRLVEIDDQQWLTHYGVFGSESEITDLIRQADSELLSLGAQYSLYIHISSLQRITDTAYLPIGDVVQWGGGPEAYKTRKDTLPGCKVRVLEKGKGLAAGFVETRGVPLHTVEKFHGTYKGGTSRLKQGRLLMPYILAGSGEGEDVFVNLVADDAKKVFTKRALDPNEPYEVILYPTFEKKIKTVLGKELRHNPDQCPDGLSWVAWAAADEAGPPDLMISYSWDLDWDYLIAYVKQRLGAHVRLWIDILACAQHPIERGDMDEISCLPEVIAFTGKTLVMPGTVKRMWCLYEFAWSINLNGGGCLFYAGFDEEVAAGLGEGARSKLSGLVEEDESSLRTDDPTSMLEDAQCFKQEDAEHIRNTIRDRLGGKRQVSMIIRHQFRSLTGGVGQGGDGGGGEGGSSVRDALVSLFLDCNGPNWKQRRNWMEGVALGEWEGVKAGGSGEDDEAGVTELQLKANNVSGEVLGIVATAAHHGLFNSLVCINIADNNATGIYVGVVSFVLWCVPFCCFAMGLSVCLCVCVCVLCVY